MKRVLLWIALAGVAAGLGAQDSAHAHPGEPQKPPQLLAGMGAHRHPIQTGSAEAQKYFDQGVTLLFGFNHEEAFRSFERAAELDPKSPELDLVIDTPGGMGKVSIGPDYVVERGPDKWTLRNYEGKLVDYPQPADKDATCAYDEIFFSS